MHITNHLFSINNLKLLATNDCDPRHIAEETLQFFNVIGPETNRDKSAKNTAVCSAGAVPLKGPLGYTYLGG